MLKQLLRAALPEATWDRLVRFRGLATWLVGREVQMARAYGLAAYSRFRLEAPAALGRRRGLRRLRLPGFRWPVYYRPGSSDQLVIRQVFAHREYDCLLGRPDVRYVLDCGANIGCTAFFLLSHYPTAQAVVVEPDPENMAVCRRNLAPFADRVTFVQAGVWSSGGPLVLDRGGDFRDGAEWSIRVRPAAPGEPADVTAVTIPDLVARAGFPRIDLLKIDIEGSETEVFSTGADRWLGYTRDIAVETHGPEAERAVAAALAGYAFDRGRSGELTVFLGITPPTPGPT